MGACYYNDWGKGRGRVLLLAFSIQGTRICMLGTILHNNYLAPKANSVTAKKHYRSKLITVKSFFPQP